MKIDKMLLIGLMLAAIFAFVWDILKLFGVVALSDFHARAANILFSLSVTILLGALIKHKYWIVAFLSALVNRLAHIVSGVLFKSTYGTEKIALFAAIIIGMISALVSSFYFFRLLKIQNFEFEKYLRFKK